jgi:hypothetical protein
MTTFFTRPPTYQHASTSGAAEHGVAALSTGILWPQKAHVGQ